MTRQKRIGIVGPNGSGKSTVCNYLITKGFEVISLSDIVREEATKRSLAHTRDTLTTLANELKSAQGMNWLAIQAREKAEQMGTNVVFDSIRNVEEINDLKNHGVTLIGITAPIEIRYKRIAYRQRETDRVDFETFKAHDERENTGKSSGQHIHNALTHCDYMLENAGEMPDLIKQLNAIIAEIETD